MARMVFLGRADASHLPSRPGPKLPLPRAAVCSGPVILMPRRIPGGVAATLDALPMRALPRLLFEGPAAGLRRALRSAASERLPRPRWLANWLIGDVLAQAGLLAELTGARALRLALEVDVFDGGFDVAPSTFRLVTSYRGAGTEWVSPRAAAGLDSGHPPTPEALRRGTRGDVAILRGRTADGDPGVLHRAARADGTQPSPLRLTIDASGPRGWPPAAPVGPATLQ